MMLLFWEKKNEIQTNSPSTKCVLMGANLKNYDIIKISGINQYSIAPTH